jgi:hypothetical protein
MENEKSESERFYCGLIFQATEETFKQIKQYLFTQTNAKLIKQVKDKSFLKIEK